MVFGPQVCHHQSVKLTSLGPQAPSPKLPRSGDLIVKEPKDDQFITYERQSDGFHSPDVTDEKKGWVDRTREKVWNSLVPEHLNQSVSKDYIPTRKYQLVRDFLGAAAGTSAVAAVMTAVGPANATLAALSVAGLSVANVNWLKDRISQVSSIAATNIARVAEKNPKPWMMVADVVNNVGTIVDTSTVLLPPVTYFPVLTGMGVVRAVANAAGGAAAANVAPRQAIKGNLGEVSVKNGNQSTLATFAGATVGIAALGALQHYMDFGTSAMIVSTVGAVAGLVANYAMLSHLDYTPINEKAMRRILEHESANPGEVPGPGKNLWGDMMKLTQQDRLVAGDRVKPLLDNPKLDELRELYKSRPYILTIEKGAPYMVRKRDHLADDQPKPASKPLPEGSDFCDKMAQVQGVYQALQAEKLLASPEFSERSQKDGKDAAERWVMEESLKQTPDDIRPFLLKCHEAGWSVDTIRFWGDERPVVFEKASAN